MNLLHLAHYFYFSTICLFKKIEMERFLTIELCRAKLSHYPKEPKMHKAIKSLI